MAASVGGHVTLTADGGIELEGMRVGRVGIADLSEVVEHSIVAIFDSIAHHVRFNNGGELYYVFNRRGELVELEARAVQVAHSANGECLLRALWPPA